MDQTEVLNQGWPIKTIYYYLTFVCNLRCVHCYVGDLLAPESHADTQRVLRDLAQGFAQGAREVVFLGGEPTLHPDYGAILAAAAEIGYRRIVVDTNGCANSPVVAQSDSNRFLVVRVSFEGVGPLIHDAIRGKGSFQKALHCLREAQSAGCRSEVTFTLHAQNCSDIGQIVDFFAAERICELNFHFVSLMGSGAAHPWLGLTPAMILAAQQELDRLRASSPMALRFPRLLVSERDWQHELAKGLACRREQPHVALILPQGQVCRCPLEISDCFGKAIHAGSSEYQGCPFSHWLLPEGVPAGYRMTCISWK